MNFLPSFLTDMTLLHLKQRHPRAQPAAACLGLGVKQAHQPGSIPICDPSSCSIQSQFAAGEVPCQLATPSLLIWPYFMAHRCPTVCCLTVCAFQLELGMICMLQNGLGTTCPAYKKQLQSHDCSTTVWPNFIAHCCPTACCLTVCAF